MKVVKHTNLLRLLIVIVALLPLMALYLLPATWTHGIGVWSWLLLAVGNGLMWLCLAIALATINRQPSQVPR